MSNIINESIIFIQNNLNDILLVSLILIIMLIFKTKYVKDSDSNVVKNKITKKTLIIENMETKNKKDEVKKEIDSMTSDFCKKLKGKSHEIEERCKKESEGSCKARSCCVLAKNKNDKKALCLAGSKTGPTYHTDENGMDLNFDYYYYQGKCYGNGCK